MDNLRKTLGMAHGKHTSDEIVCGAINEIERLRTLAAFAFHAAECELFNGAAGRERECSCGYAAARLAVNSSVCKAKSND